MVPRTTKNGLKNHGQTLFKMRKRDQSEWPSSTSVLGGREWGGECPSLQPTGKVSYAHPAHLAYFELETVHSLTRYVLFLMILSHVKLPITNFVNETNS